MEPARLGVGSIQMQRNLQFTSICSSRSKETYVEESDYLIAPEPFFRAVMTTIQKRKPISSANLAGHPLRGPALGKERRAPWSRFRGVVTTRSYNTTDIRSFFDQCASTGFPEQHGHPQRLLEYRLALVRNLARPNWTSVAAMATISSPWDLKSLVASGLMSHRA